MKQHILECEGDECPICFMEERIEELEEKNQLLQPDEESRKAYALAIEGQAKHIKALEAGACRFHCRTAKENWIEGYGFALWRETGVTSDNDDLQVAYHEWKRQQEASDKDD